MFIHTFEIIYSVILNSILSFADMKCQLVLSISKMQSILFIERVSMSNLQIKASLGRVGVYNSQFETSKYLCTYLYIYYLILLFFFFLLCTWTGCWSSYRGWLWKNQTIGWISYMYHHCLSTWKNSWICIEVSEM